MQKLFGIPLNDLMVALLILFGLGVLIISVLAVRNRVMFKVAVRNIPRRPAQTGLIVLGLMLATLLFSASFATGDTMTHSIKMQAVKDLGPVDVIVQSEGKGPSGEALSFDAGQLDVVRQKLSGDSQVKGVSPLLSKTAPVVVPDTRQSEPGVAVLGFAPDQQAGLEPLVDAGGKTLSLKDLPSGQVYLGQDAADKLNVSAGKSIMVFLGQQPTSVTVAGVYKSGGNPASSLAMVMPLDRLQQLTGETGKITSILIANQGDHVASAQHSDAVISALKPGLDGTGLAAKAVKQEALDGAEAAGNSFSSIFLLFGQFSILAGILLIFLIFVMLAAERRGELGLARAIGTQRRHVVQLFLFEGSLYGLMAGLVGSFLGLAIGWGMVRIMVKALTSVETLQLTFYFNWRSVIISYTLGVVFTFLVVGVSAWRVSRLNIVRAVRGIPEPKIKRQTRRGLIVAIATPIVGALFAYMGIQGNQGSVFMLGSSLVIVGVPLLARRFGLHDRIAFTVAGLGVLAWWLVPDSMRSAIAPTGTMSQGIEMFFLSGIMVVMGGVWTIMYNSDVMLSGLMAVFGKFRGFASVLKMAVTYPMQSRFRTGATLAMFSLVVFTLIVMAFIINGMASVYEDTGRLSGGFQVRANTSYTNPIPNLKDAIGSAKDVSLNDVQAIGGASMVPMSMKQDGTGKDFVDFYAAGVDKGYSDAVGYQMAMMAPGFNSEQDVWRALQEQPGTAVVPFSMVPAKVNYNMGGTPPPIQLTGFYVEDKKVPEGVYLQLKDPGTGKEQRVRVIGVLNQDAMYSLGVTVSQETLNSVLAQPMPSTSYWLRLKPGVDAAAFTRGLKAQFLENGMQAEVTDTEIRKGAEANIMINNLLQGFMGLGLVVGISALGVIAARSVVERRRQIGMLRAVGFQKTMVQSTFLIESSFVALLGIVLGVALGMGLSVQVVDTMKQQLPALHYTVPWANIIVVVVVAYVASLLTTYLPARQASKVYPAEALRYE